MYSELNINMKQTLLSSLLLLIVNPTFSQTKNKSSDLSYDLMFDMASTFSIDTGKKRSLNSQYVFIDFQPALTSYTMALDPSQRKKLLSAIQQYKSYRTTAINNNTEYQKRITAFTFYEIKDHVQQESSYNPSLTVSFSSAGVADHLLIFSIQKIQQNKRIFPETFYLEHDGVLQLEELLQDDYLAKTS